jgi:hypothetical protein
LQTRLGQFTLPKQKIEEFQSLVQSIVNKLREEGISENGIDKLIVKEEQLEKVHTRLRRSPEEVTKELIIEPIFDFLGYYKKGKSSGSASSKDQKAVDYTLE